MHIHSSVQGCMRGILLLGMLEVVGCGNALDAYGLEDYPDAEVETGTEDTSDQSDTLSPAETDSLPDFAGSESDEDSTPVLADSTSADSSGDSSGSLDTWKPDAASGSDSSSDTKSEDDACAVGHHVSLGNFNYSSCSSKIYSDALLSEQIKEAKLGNPSTWLWTGPSTIFCLGTRPMPFSSGMTCHYWTITVLGGSYFNATWCVEESLAGRFLKSTTPGDLCPMTTDPVSWW